MCAVYRCVPPRAAFDTVKPIFARYGGNKCQIWVKDGQKHCEIWAKYECHTAEIWERNMLDTGYVWGKYGWVKCGGNTGTIMVVYGWNVGKIYIYGWHMGEMFVRYRRPSFDGPYFTLPNIGYTVYLFLPDPIPTRPPSLYHIAITLCPKVNIICNVIRTYFN